MARPRLTLGEVLVIVAMWLVDPWFADSRELVKVRRIEFHKRIAGATAPAIESIPGQPSDDVISGEPRDAWAEPPRKRRFDC